MITKALLQKVPIFTDLTETRAQHDLEPLHQAVHVERHLPRHPGLLAGTESIRWRPR